MECSDADCDYPVHAVGCGVSKILAASVIPPRAFLSNAPEYVSSIRGALLRGAFGEGTSSPNVSVGDGNPSLHHSWFLTSQSQKGRQDVSEPVGTLCVYYMVEEVLDHVAKEIT